MKRVCSLILFAASSLALGCQQPEPPPKEVVRPVKIAKVTANGRSGKAEYPGRVAAADEAELSFGVEGKLVELAIDEGQPVKKGQVLARLDAEEYGARLEFTGAKERAARADYNRIKELYESNASTKQDLDLARRNYEMAQAQTKLTKKSMGDTVLRAPFAGTIAKKMAENFQSVRAKQPIALLQDVNKNGFEIKIDIPERDVAGAEKGLTLEQRTEKMKPQVMLTSAPKVPIPAYFKSVTTIADPVTRTFEVTLGFAPPETLSVAPGMTGRVIVVWPPLEGQKSKILIPAQAIVPGSKDGKAKVWTVDTKAMVVKGVELKVGAMTGEQVEVESGLKPGASIALSGVQQLREGMKVSRYQKKNF